MMCDIVVEVLYVSTEGRLYTQRLEQMIEARAAQDESLKSFLSVDNVIVHQTVGCDPFLSHRMAR